MPDMCALKIFRIVLCAALAGGSVTLSHAAADENVFGSWHFAGASQCAKDTNFAAANAVFALKSSQAFKDLVLTRFSSWLAGALQLNASIDIASTVRPMLDDLLLSESYFALGGRPQGPLNFILAIRLDDKHAQLWQIWQRPSQPRERVSRRRISPASNGTAQTAGPFGRFARAIGCWSASEMI